MNRLEKCLVAVLLVFGVALFLIPGVRFLFYLCFEGAACVWLYAILKGRAAQSRKWLWCKRVFLAGLTAVIWIWAVSETVVVFHSRDDWSALPSDAVIVLGAGIQNGNPSRALQTRLDAGAAYARNHPDIPVVLTGGLGLGEIETEAAVMLRYMEAQYPDLLPRLIPEPRATSTAENYVYSRPLLQEAGVDTDTADIAVVTNRFHQFRARLIAERLGLHTISIPADGLYWWVELDCTAREGFALVKTLLFDWERVIPDRRGAAG